MVDAVLTKIRVDHYNMFRIFLDANDMKTADIGYYQFHDPELYLRGYTENRISYKLPVGDYMVESNIIYMTMKYGGLESAFMQFLKDLRRY